MSFLDAIKGFLMILGGIVVVLFFVALAVSL